MPSASLPSKVVCVGRNYAAHARELGNAIPEQPILFLKPSTSVCRMAEGVRWPSGQGSCHHEAELCVRLGSPLRQASPEQALAAVREVTLGLDLTLRDLQDQLKARGHPWERAKAFDGACVLGDWLGVDAVGDLRDVRFSLHVDGELRQQGHTADMLFGVAALLSEISQTFSLLAGDVVMTGTPAGVAALQPGQSLLLTLDTLLGDVQFHTTVIGAS
jgi:2-keto-4-pentenoate hydratase/2-oxohepta-3-ene-1,7-dioic acid hydratase in catechol pathway